MEYITRSAELSNKSHGYGVLVGRSVGGGMGWDEMGWVVLDRKGKGNVYIDLAFFFGEPGWWLNFEIPFIFYIVCIVCELL